MKNRRDKQTRPTLEGFEERLLTSSLGWSAPARSVEAAASRGTAEKVRRNVVYASATDGSPLKLDVYTPGGAAPTGGRPVILAIHGGGWRKLGKDDYGKAVSEFTKYGYVVVAPNYELSAPGRPTYTAAVDQVRSAVRWIRTNAAALGANPDRVAAMGESAGGNLAALLGAHAVDSASRVQAVVDFYGPADLITLDGTSRIGREALRQFIGGTPAEFPDRARAVSPVFQVDASSAPMFLAQGRADTIVPPDQTQELADSLAASGVRRQVVWVPNAGHGFRLRAGGIDFVPLILAFLDSKWNDGA